MSTCNCKKQDGYANCCMRKLAEQERDALREENARLTSAFNAQSLILKAIQDQRDKLMQDMNLVVSDAGKGLIAERDGLAMELAETRKQRDHEVTLRGQAWTEQDTLRARLARASAVVEAARNICEKKLIGSAPVCAELRDALAALDAGKDTDEK